MKRKRKTKKRKNYRKQVEEPEESSTSSSLSSSSSSSSGSSSSSSDGSGSSSSSSEKKIKRSSEAESASSPSASSSSSSSRGESSTTSSSSAMSSSSSSSSSPSNHSNDKREERKSAPNEVAVATPPPISLPTIPRKKGRKPGDNDVSVRALKYQILGRDIDSSRTPDKQHEQSTTPPVSLRNELTCVICHDVFIEPISLPCGHSFCKDCLDWWWLQPQKRGAEDCPTCRSRLSPKQQDVPSFQVNLALRACILALYGDEVKRRVLAKTSGEHGARHNRGYEVLTSLNHDDWKRLDYTTSMFAKSESCLQVRHSIVLDDQDQQMQLGLCLYGLPAQQDTTAMIIRMVLMTLQEDEVDDQQFPVFTSAADEDDHNFICTSQERFRYSFLEVASCSTSNNDQTGRDNLNVYNYNWEPIARVALDQEENMAELGVVEYRWKPRNNHKRLRFRHSETGAELELDLSNLTMTVKRDNAEDENLHGGRREIAGNTFVYDQDDRHLDEEENHNNEYEDDGFLVKDDDESDLSGQFSPTGYDDRNNNDEGEDICCLCHDGGELMICGAGDDDHAVGCGKSFHMSCVGRDEIPAGDWICTPCAEQQSGSLSLIVGMTSSNRNYGYEFPVTAEEQGDNNSKEQETRASASKHHLEDSDSDEDGDEQDVKSKSKTVGFSKSNHAKRNDQKKKRRRVIEDDSD